MTTSAPPPVGPPGRRSPVPSGRLRARAGHRAGAAILLACGTFGGLLARAEEEPTISVDPTSSATIEQPGRAFGHVLGDVLVQRIRIAADADADAAIAAVEALPPGRIDAWLERLPVRLVEGSDGAPALELRYQIVNAPTEPLVVRLPPLALARADGTRIDVPEWPVGIGPLTPREIVGEGELLAMRPDRRLPPFGTQARRERLGATALALAAAALAWLGWWLWRRRRDRGRLPFARAVHAMRALPAAARDESPDAWTALHRALDDTAGGTVHRASLERLLAAAPWLAPSRDAIERFYEASAARFFSQPPRAEPFPVGELARRLYRAEKRQAR